MLALLRTEGDKFAAFVDGLSEAVSGRAGHDAARRAAGNEVAPRDADVAQGARDASPRAADADAADDRPRAAPDPPSAGADRAAPTVERCGSARRRWRFCGRSSATTIATGSRRARISTTSCPCADARAHRAAGGRFPVLRAGSRRQSEDRCTASIATPGSPPTRRRSRPTSRRSFPAAGSRSIRARVSTSRSRPAGCGSAAACTRRRRAQLQAVREHIAANLRQFRAIVESPAFRRTVGQLEGEQLQRVPRGFAKDHPAAAYLKYRQFLAGREFPGSFRDQPAVLCGRARRVPSGRAAHAVSERAVTTVDGRQSTVDCRTVTTMSFNGRRRVPPPVNEPVRSYAPGSPERASLKARLKAMAARDDRHPAGHRRPGRPHRRHRAVGHAARSRARAGGLSQSHSASTSRQAVDAARAAHRDWSRWSFDDRAAVFLKAAELLTTTWRDTVNAATMLGQSKTVFQAEIDSACEIIDFWRFNVALRPGAARRAAGQRPLDVEPARVPRRSRGSSTRSRRSTSRRSPPTCPPRRR